jgi:hypothetical protein
MVVKRNLREVRNVDKWVLSLLRKENDGCDRHQPGDIEDLSRKVREACQEEMSANRIVREDMSERVIALLNDLPVGDAVEVRPAGLLTSVHFSTFLVNSRGGGDLLAHCGLCMVRGASEAEVPTLWRLRAPFGLGLRPLPCRHKGGPQWK